MNVESRFASVIVFVDHPQLRTVPCRAVTGSDDTTLACRRDRLQSAAKREIDQLDIMDRNVGARIATSDPFRELAS